MKDGFIPVAVGSPRIRVADCHYNAEQIFTMMRAAEREGVKVLVLPELCLTGYTCGDLFYQDTLLDGACAALQTVLDATRNLEVLTAVGMPVQVEQKLYNCAVVIQKGEILGVVPKTVLPNYGEFYEKRQFSPAPEDDPFYVDHFCGQTVLFGARQLFQCNEIPALTVGFEICEDLWASAPPSVALARAGATVIGNLSASNDVIGKGAYRRRMVSVQSARLQCGYLYASAGEGESTADLVFGAHQIIAENGTLLAEKRFENGLLRTEIDVSKLVYERRRTQSMGTAEEMALNVFSLTVADTKLTRPIAPLPFVPADKDDRAARCEEILLIASLGLKKRLEHTGAKTAVVGLSGGLDSTLALLITMIAMQMLGRSPSDAIAVTMPCFGTTDRTKNNAVELACSRWAATLRTDGHFRSRAQSISGTSARAMSEHDVTFENAQARERTQVLMDIANKTGGIVIGTGDLSELALGWATYNGDHMSMYAVNASIPKTLVRHLVEYVAKDNARKGRGTDATCCEDILDTPVSPELLPAVNGEPSPRKRRIWWDLMSCTTFSSIILSAGLSRPARSTGWRAAPLPGAYSDAVILKWLKTFYRRFFAQQFKRNCMPDGPKVGSVAFSPRGDWRMPSDAVAKLWLDEVELLQDAGTDVAKV